MSNVTDREIEVDGKPTTLGKLWQKVGENPNAPAFIGAVHQLLYDQRLKARPYEISRYSTPPEDEDVSAFQCAALLRTNHNQFYLGANQHIQPSPANNNCAEASVILEAINDTPEQEVYGADLFFMGGKSLTQNKQVVQAITQQHQGVHVTPCGNCREMMKSHSNPQEPLRTHIYPLTEPGTALQPDGEGQAYEHRIKTYASPQALLPHDNITFNVSREAVQAGLDELEESPSKNERKTATQSVNPQKFAQLEKKLTADASQANLTEFSRQIYKNLRLRLRNEIHNPNREAIAPETLADHVINLCVVRTHDGQYYTGRYVEGENAQSMRSSLENAIQNSAGNRNITDIFVMHTNLTALREQLKHTPNTFSIKTTGADALTAIDKARSCKPEEECPPSPFAQSGKTAPRIHFFAPISSTKEHFTADAVRTFDLDELMPDRFVAPKTEMHTSAALSPPSNTVRAGVLHGQQQAPERRI